MSDFGVARVSVQLDSRTVDRDVQRLLDQISRQVADLQVRADARTIPRTIESAIAAADTGVVVTGQATELTGDIEGAVDAADTHVTVTGDAGELTGDVTAAVDAGDSHVEVTGDATELTGDIDSAVDAADSEVVVTGEATDVTGSINAAVDAADTHVVATADASGLQEAADASDALAFGMAEAASSAGILGTTIAGLSLAVVGKQLFDAAQAASALEESTSKAGQVFGDAVPIIEEFGETSATSVGLSSQAAIEAAGTFGNLFTSMGLTKQAAAAMSPDVVQLAADLASFNNIGLEDALEKIRSGLVGEIEPLRTLGVSFNAAQVEAKGVQLGLEQVNGQLTEGAKVQARWALIQDLASNAAGDFARTSEGLANQQRILKAEIENARIEVGEQFLPLLLDLVELARNRAIPAGMELAEAFGPLLSDALRALVPALGVGTELLVGFAGPLRIIAQLVDKIPDPVLQVAAAFFAANRIMGVAGGVVGRLGGSFSTLGGVLGGAGPVIGGLFALKIALDAALGDADFQAADVQRLTDNLETFGRTGQVSGELARVAGDDWGQLKASFDLLDDPGILDQAEKGVAGFTETVSLGLFDTKSGLTDAEARIKSFDEGLAQLQSSDAAQAFDVLATAARELGVPIDELRERLPKYNEAVDASRNVAAAAGTAVNKYGVDVEVAGDQAATAAGQQEAHAAALAENAAALRDLQSATPGVFQALSQLQGPGGDLTTEFVNLALAMDRAQLSEEQLASLAEQLGVPLDTLQENVAAVVGVVEGFVSSVEQAVPTIGQALSGLGEDVTFQGIRDEFAKTLEDITNFEKNIAVLAQFPNVQAAAIQGGPQVAAALAQGFKDGKTEALTQMELQALGTAQVQQRIIDEARDKYGPAFAAQLSALGLGGTTAFVNSLQISPAARTELEDTQGEYLAAQTAHKTAAEDVGKAETDGYSSGLSLVPETEGELGAAQAAYVAAAAPHKAEATRTGGAGSAGYRAGLAPVDENARALMAAARGRVTAERVPQATAARDTASAAQAAYKTALTPVDENARAAMAAAKDRITSARFGMQTAGITAGSSGGRGFSKGLELTRETLDRVVKRWRTNIIAGIGAIFETHSPSRVMERQGALVGEGFARGIIRDNAKWANLVAAAGLSLGGAFGGAVGKSASFGGLQPGFARQIQALIALYGGHLVSGWRSSAKQAQLYAAYVRRGFAPPRVAPPGRSMHERGLAADMSPPYGPLARAAHMLGLKAPVPGEPWHWQPGYTTRRSLYQRGAWELRRDEDARLHRGEMVVPEAFATSLRQAVAGAAARGPDPMGRQIVDEQKRHANIDFAGHAGTHAWLRSIREQMKPLPQQALERLLSPSEALRRAIGNPGLVGRQAGAWKLLENELAQLHRGEMVVPAPTADAVRTAVEGPRPPGGPGLVIEQLIVQVPPDTADPFGFGRKVRRGFESTLAGRRIMTDARLAG